MARTWSDSRGGQCQKAKPAEGMGDLCASHLQTWRTHGRVDDAIPVQKLRQFLLTSNQSSYNDIGQYVHVTGDGWGEGEGRHIALVVDASRFCLHVAALESSSGTSSSSRSTITSTSFSSSPPAASCSGLAAEKLVLRCWCTPCSAAAAGIRSAEKSEPCTRNTKRKETMTE